LPVAKKVQIAHPREVTHDEWVTRKSEPVSAKPVEPLKRLTVDIPEGLHTRIKLACVANKQKMTEAIRELLEEHWPEAA
jgi:hypothetical protein